MKKKIKAKSRRFTKNFEFIDYRGRKIMTNNLAAEQIFGTQEPDKKLLKAVAETILNPDWYYQNTTYTIYGNFFYSKYIGGFDYIIGVQKGYASSKTLWHICTFQKVSIKKIEKDALRFTKPVYVPHLKMVRVLPGAAHRKD